MINFFISHSKNVKQSIAIPITQTLISIGLNVWIDRKDIVAGGCIYHDIINAMNKTQCAIVFIDPSFLYKKWTLQEIDFLHKREMNEKRRLIIPVYVQIEKEKVFKTIPWLEGRAFEKLNQNAFSLNNNLDLFCRIISKWCNENIPNNSLELLKNNLPMLNCFCKETLKTLITSQLYLSNDFRLASIEICNIINFIYLLFADCVIPLENVTIKISYNFIKIIRPFLFEKQEINYDIYISLYKLMMQSAHELNCSLNATNN